MTSGSRSMANSSARAEFDFRYSNRAKLGVDDQERARRALYGIIGKRLTYRAADRTEAIETPPF